MTMQENKKSVAANVGTVDDNTNIKTNDIVSSNTQNVNQDFVFSSEIGNASIEIEKTIDLLHAFISLYSLEGFFDEELSYDQKKTKSLIYVENLKKYMSIIYIAQYALEEISSKLDEISNQILERREV